MSPAPANTKLVLPLFKYSKYLFFSSVLILKNDLFIFDASLSAYKKQEFPYFVAFLPGKRETQFVRLRLLNVIEADQEYQNLPKQS